MEGDDKNALFFKDTGLGIRVADQAKIFDLFSRLHRAEEFPGSGVGLALCRRIVMNHGGSISVESEVGVGSTFKVIFPTKPTLVFTNLQKAERTGMLI